MGRAAQQCVNHPGEETRVTCSSCDAPICPRCMRSGPVGQKCPACARPAAGSRALGKPAHHVRAVGAGLAVAVVGGLLFAELTAIIRFGSLILSALFGFGVGRAVAWGAKGQAQQPFLAIAIGCAVLGIAIGLVARFGAVVPGGAFLVLAYPLAGWFAARGLQSG